MPSSALRPRSSLFVGLVLGALGVALPALAATYWTATQLLKDYFPGAQRIAPHAVTLSDAEATAIAAKLGVAPDKVKRTWNVYVGEADGKRLGYAVLDAELGLHENIDYGVRYDQNGAVSRLEIMEFREPYGDQVRGQRFRAQFIGKTARDPITAGQDIAIVSGASISSKSVAFGVKRDTLVLETALKNGIP